MLVRKVIHAFKGRPPREALALLQQEGKRYFARSVVRRTMQVLDKLSKFTEPGWYAGASLALYSDAVLGLHGGRSTVPEIVKKHMSEFIANVQGDDIVGAAHHLNQIQDAGFSVHCESPASGLVNIVARNTPDDPHVLARELLSADLKHLHDTVAVSAISAAVSCAQTLYRRGDRDAAQTFLTEFQRCFRNQFVYMLEDVSLAQSRLTAEGDAAALLVRNMAIGGLDYLEHFKGKYCNHPFDDLEIIRSGEIYVCCPSFLPKPIGNAFDIKDVLRLKSSKEFSKIKDSILQQNFKYCRWMQCGKFIRNELVQATPEQKTVYAPVYFRLSYDATCNLWCPSCRKEKIVAKGEERDRIMALTENTVLPLLKDAEICFMNGYGDILASRACRRILEVVNSREYPKLKFDFITNGVLFTRSEWEKFPNIHDMVRSLRVSIDATQQSTYDKNRLGGNWEVLVENLEFMSTLRRRGVIGAFMISMVVQDNNYREMAELALWAKRLGCDYVIFEPIFDWGTYAIEHFRRKAVHYGEHPQHESFRHELARMQQAIAAANEEDRRQRGAQAYDIAVSLNF